MNTRLSKVQSAKSIILAWGLNIEDLVSSIHQDIKKGFRNSINHCVSTSLSMCGNRTLGSAPMNNNELFSNT